MITAWVLWVLALALTGAAAAERGGSLRGALEALQRRQRGRAPPMAPDYDLYEVLPPNGYIPDTDYTMENEDLEGDPETNYILKLLEENDRPMEGYEYKLVKKKSNHLGPVEINRKESAFRERSHHSDNDRLRDLFTDRNEVENPKEAQQDRAENDAEYALLLGQLWSKYKNNKQHNTEGAPQGVVKLYKEKIVKKRYPDNWGPIAFKKKRSPDAENERSSITNFDDSKVLPGPVDLNNFNLYDQPDDDNDDLREEYAIAFQPLDDDSLSDLADDDQYRYDVIEKRFPVTKRSSGPYDWGKPKTKKRFAQDQDKREVSKRFRSSSGTDPKIIKDLSKLFGDSEPEFIKNPVKRSSDQQGNSYESKPPQLAMATHNHTNERFNISTSPDDTSHEHHHNLHHPGISGKEVEHVHDHDHSGTEKPITIKKKSIDWSTYFGIDKRKKKSVSFNDFNENKLRKQYFDTFNKEIIYPLNSFRKHSNVKRNYVQRPENEETEIQIDNARAIAVRDGDKRNTAQERESKLDNIDRKLRNMEGMIVDEALHYSNAGEELDTKEEQEMKEKLLSRLAAAYSLEKMRKALREFKQSLQIQKPDTTMGPSSGPMEEAKEKRVAVKKEKVDINNNEIPLFNKGDDKEDDFEEEQGAGHYLNGKIENQFSEGYMGGSGRHRTPVVATGSATGACPVLAKIVQRCRGVDLLAGDRGQLFLPLCSLHQICYLCGEAPPTTCDLVFLSEADTSCEGDTGCQRAARSALMALRELHDSLADELDGECEASPCLPATLKLNIGWQRALQRFTKEMTEIRETDVNDKGFDNPAATEDDGSNLRPDLVISVQPRQNESRAELPVSTLDWRSTPRGQFIPVHGLDFLIGVSTLQIQQTVELDDLISRVDSENRYIVRVPNGESLYLASEVSSQTQRCLCGSGRAFVMHLHDNTRQEALQMQRRLAAASCCFPCRLQFAPRICLQEMKVITPPGDYIGRVQQQCTWVVPFYLVRDANDQVIFAVEGPAVMKRSALMLSEFKIMTGDSLREVGKIAHGWDRELVSFTTTLSIPHNAVQPRHKALLLAASFLLEYTYFERAKSSCLRCNCL
ncbi:uncharacterized protein LOC133518570 [Cydia pomonella]|uniref:uncharacterized protein LOC133518570 n=1 Tax=Cydia pomonella TaxID=82600 RepID=UPI002ADDAB5F|nr:uncharacterized protein LOC133518570 [Cydia pomonella]